MKLNRVLSFFSNFQASFGIGHTFYISAFGFRPLNLPLGLFLYGLGCLGQFFHFRLKTSIATVCFPLTSPPTPFQTRPLGFLK